MGSPPESRSRFEDELPRHLDRWVESSLISRDQADAIRALERRPAPARRVPLVTEALGYLGVALAIAAAIALLVQIEVDLSLRQWVVVFGLIALLLLGAGWWLRGSEEPAVGRLCSLLWFLSVGAWALFLGLVTVDVWSPDPDKASDFVPVVLTSALGAALYSGWLFALRRRALQQVAFFVSLIATVHAAVFAGAGGDWERDEAVAFSIALWALGALWLALSSRDISRPVVVGSFLASATLLVAPSILEPEAQAAGLFLGLSTAGSLMALSVVLRRPLLLWVGSVGLFGYLVSIIGVYLSDALGWPLALFLSGVVLLVLAVVTGRLKRIAGPPPFGAPSPA